MSTTTTFKVALLASAKRLCQGRDPIEVVATGGSTTTLVVSSYAYTSASAHMYNGAWIYVATDTGGAAPQGEIRQVTRGGFSGATGTWTVAPAFSAGIASGDTIYILYGLNRQAYLDAWNEIVGTAYTPSWLPHPNLVTDGDLESTAMTNWTDVGSPTTTDKSTTAARVFCGTQSLQVVTDATGEGIISDSVNVLPGENLLVSGAVMVDAGDVTFQLRDVTNSTTLEESRGIDMEGYAVVFFTHQVGTGTEQVAIRVLSDTVDATTFYLGYAQIISQERTAYVLPSSFDNSVHIDEVFYWPHMDTTDGEDLYIPFSGNRQVWPHGMDGLRDFQGANSQRMEIQKAPPWPLFTAFRRDEAGNSTADTATTAMPEDTVVEGMLSLLYAKQASRFKSNPELMGTYLGYAQKCGAVYKDLLRRDGIIAPQDWRLEVAPTVRVRT